MCSASECATEQLLLILTVATRQYKIVTTAVGVAGGEEVDGT
jgi:hypothetical protein